MMAEPQFKKQNELCSKEDFKMKSKSFRVLELYCGIGGMRYSLEAAGVSFEIVAAIDINPVVSDVYKHNFKGEEHSHRNLLSFTSNDIGNMEVDIITMSPPCQPFTRVGLKKDIEDARSSSFLHVLKILKQLEKKPKYIILENVKGFEESHARLNLIETLQNCGYRYQEFLLSPKDFNIPNSRLRYYLIAKLKDFDFAFIETKQILQQMPGNWKKYCTNCPSKTDISSCILNHFLEERPPEYFESFLVPDKILFKYWSVFDIVSGESPFSCCFTKAYSRFAQGTGSVICSLPKDKMDIVFKLVSLEDDPRKKLNSLKQLKLRYFTPREVANLMCFPSSFEFPKHITMHQMYKSLGNSLNVYVVTCLMQLLFSEISE